MLKHEYVRGNKNQIIGRKTTGFSNGDTIARDADGKVLAAQIASFISHGTRKVASRARIRVMLIRCSSGSCINSLRPREECMRHAASDTIDRRSEP